MPGLVFLLFFASGLSGLIYQVVWVRAFGNVFGNTVESAALVVAVFMLGLGAGSYAGGRWADRRYRDGARSLLRAYAVAEMAIAVFGLAVSLILPALGQLSVLVSSYERGERGWWVLSSWSLAGRAFVAVGLLLPITLAMGATLTLVIRHLVRTRPGVDGWNIAVLYAVNTVGAALGAVLTDFWLLPAVGLLRTQLVAVVLNASIGVVAWVAQAHAVAAGTDTAPVTTRGTRSTTDPEPAIDASPASVWFASVAMAMSGFASLGLEIVWLRHMAIQLGAFRAVFSLLLAVILSAMGTGSLAAAWLQRRPSWASDPWRAARGLAVVQCLVAAAALAGVAQADVSRVDAALATASANGVLGSLADVRVNLVPILIEVGLPSLLMGFGFPLANAWVQRVQASVGHRAGVLYLSNTIGAVVGSLVAGFVLLPLLGLQQSVGVLAVASAGSALPVVAARWPGRHGGKTPQRTASPLLATALSAALAGGALIWWARLPPDTVVERAMPRLGNGERRIALTEGLNEVIAITEVASGARRLLTNGHAMSDALPLSQRYMRALAHLPLLSMEQPTAALVIGFGVGNTTHAVTLHPSIVEVEVADLSRGVLEHSDHFVSANQGVLHDPRVRVFVNDGRHHLLMRPEASFDLVTLEPPPIAYAGAASLYSRDFYTLARSRLKPGGYVSQWLPVYQVPAPTTLALIRAFVDVFPDAVVVSGAGSDLLLLGTLSSPIAVDPDALERRLQERRAVRADLRRLDLGSVVEIVGAFVGSASTLREATQSVEPVTDDRPVQEYAVRSLLAPRDTGLSAAQDLEGVNEWCPNCFRDGRPTGSATGLDVYLALLSEAYRAPTQEFQRAARDQPFGSRMIAGSAYLGAVLPESAGVHNTLGIAAASRGRLEDAIAEFRRALALSANLPETHWHLGAALADVGSIEEATGSLRRAVELDPSNGLARYDLARVRLRVGARDEAVEQLRIAASYLPDSADVHTTLGAALAQRGELGEAIEAFRRAAALQPDDATTLRNLAVAESQLKASRSRSR